MLWTTSNIYKGVEHAWKGVELKLQYFGHLMLRTDSLEKTRMLGKTEGKDRGWDGWIASLTRWTWVWASSGSWWWTGKPVVLQSMGSQRVGHDWATELNWEHEWYYDPCSPLPCNTLNCSTIFNFFFLIHFIFWPQGMWDLSSLIRDWTCAPCSGSTES